MRLSNGRLKTAADSAQSCRSLIVSTPASFFLLSMTTTIGAITSFGAVAVPANQRCLG